MRPAGDGRRGGAADRGTGGTGGPYAVPVPLRFARGVAICAVGLLLAVGAAAPAAAAASAPGWRIVAVLRHCGNDSLSSIVATGPRDAWALGQPPWGGGAGCGADVEHWDGAAWRRVPVPPSVYLGDSLSEQVAASSASDAWIFPASSAQIGDLSYTDNSALHWNGTAWHASGFPAKLIVQSAADLGPGDAWAFGVIQTSADTTVPYTARYNGRAWHRVRQPAAPMAIGSAGRDGLWVVGPTVATAAKTASQQRIIGLYWNGRSWRRLAVPKVAVPPGQSAFDAASVAAGGPRDLWWSYQAANQTTSASRNGLLHWNGAAWHAIALPAAIADVDAMTPDGHGGIWLTADAGLNLVQYWYHYDGGHWTRTLVPAPRGYGTTVFGLAWIPGTTSVWADGEADANTGTHTVGVIAKYGA
jgi:hypothetical protein